MQPIMPLSSYAAYRRLCAERGYCDPFIPYVGDKYGKDVGLKFLYCGGAAWWADHNAAIDDDAEALAYAAEASSQFIAGGMYSAPFWRLFWQAAEIVPGLKGQSHSEVLSRFAWTNISKTGIVGQSAPPDDDRDLRALDVEQFRHELDVLQPDILVCVSGSLVPSTAFALFDTPGWQAVDGIEPVTASTWIRRSDWGGWLLWTMHPAYKSRAWFASVLTDTATILKAIKAERGEH